MPSKARRGGCGDDALAGENARVVLMMQNTTSTIVIQLRRNVLRNKYDCGLEIRKTIEFSFRAGGKQLGSTTVFGTTIKFSMQVVFCEQPHSMTLRKLSLN